jgi:pimeloyl-ACP methyl ester carboxylesterase
VAGKVLPLGGFALAIRLKVLQHMNTQTIRIESIPAILWGPPAESVYIFVHGKMSRKEEAEGFAEIATRKGYQVLSFDLPEHGERKTGTYRCTVQNGVHDLQIISKFVTKKWENISLFGNSLGAYFSLVAYQELRFRNCLFLSPILDMEHLIRNMMKWSHVSEELLKEKQEIPTPMGETLSWSYYTYVREHPIRKWENQTHILYGSNDHVTERCIVDRFVTKFHCHLEVLQNGEHYFHTQEQLEVVDRWLHQNI